jgi:CRISPR-associated endonuclease Csn1
MKKILGLDLGTNSIGWAIVDEEGSKILGIGSRVFPEGIVRDKGEEKSSKNASRSVDRQIRRQYFRKRLRKIKLLEVLIDLSGDSQDRFCPLTHEELKQWKVYNKAVGKASRKFPSSEALTEWLKLNPYELRAKALNEDLTRAEFGRVFYHLIQRRGFLSGRKTKDDGAIFKGKENVIGISETKKELDGGNITLGSYLNTIIPESGQPFKRIEDSEGNALKARARYTLREMYSKEFEAIWSRQAKQLDIADQKRMVRKERSLGNPYKFGKKENGYKKRIQDKLNQLSKSGVKGHLDITNPENAKLLSEVEIPLKDFLAGGDFLKQENSVLFYQRALRSQKSTLGACTLEGKPFFQKAQGETKAKWITVGPKPCPTSHPMFELKRAYEFINSIEYGSKQKLDQEQRLVVLELMLSKDKTFNFSEIPEKLNLLGEKFNYEDEQKLAGCPTWKKLTPLFTDVFEPREYLTNEGVQEKVDAIWHCFHFYNDSTKLYEKLVKDFGLDSKFEEKVRGREQEDGSRTGAIVLNDDYGNISLRAIRNILPYLIRERVDGNEKPQPFVYSDAVLLGGVRNAFGDRWEYFEDFHAQIEKNVLIINRDRANKEGDAIRRIKEYLMDPDNEFGFSKSPRAMDRLYHHSQDTAEKIINNALGDVPALRNPIVQAALFELRALVADLQKEYLNEGEHFHQIKVELAREMKLPKSKRLEQTKENNKRNDENKEAKESLSEYGLAHSRRNIHKYLIWKEIDSQQHGGPVQCPYTGKTINRTDLFNDNQFQIEHILPQSKSLDDSLGNKTICDARFNGLKGERTPFQFYEMNSDARLWGASSWEDVEERAFRLLPYHKAKRFTSKTAHESDFASQKLNDTRYISREAKKYLGQICADVQVFPGQLTADLRKKWGLNSILANDIEVSNDTASGSHWAKLNEQGEVTGLQPIYNRRPENEAGEFLIRGEVKAETFKSKYLQFEVNAPELVDGEYWLKVRVRETPTETKVIPTSRPETEEGEILLVGTVDKEKFTTKLLSAKLDAKGSDNGKFWAKLKVFEAENKFYTGREKKKMPKAKGDQIILRGKVEDGMFRSRVYECSTDQPDGKYYALIRVDRESAEYSPTKNIAPEPNRNQIRVTGDVQGGLFHPSLDRERGFSVNGEDGLYWAVFDLRDNPDSFAQNAQDELYLVKNVMPVADGSETILEGTVRQITSEQEDDIVDEETGEVVAEHKKVFSPVKNRGDHRHHAIDALVVALTKASYMQALNDFNANKKAKQRAMSEFDKEKLKFPIPWAGFRAEAERMVSGILVSHKKVNRVLTVRKNKVKKNGKEYENMGVAARGQLHKEFVFGKRQAPTETEPSFHIRKKLTDLKTDKQIEKIVDEKVRDIVIRDRKREAEINAELEKLDKVLKSNRTLESELGRLQDERHQLVIEKANLFVLPNKNGAPVPIKRVRIRENLGNAEQLKDLNQHVNPRNNHHVLIYRNDEGEVNEELVTRWKAVERKRQGNQVVLLPENARKHGEFVATLQINDMFLLGLNENALEWNSSKLVKSLYRVQKVSSGDFNFRHHLASTIDDPNECIRIRSVKGWEEWSPIKVQISRTGKITREPAP